MSPFLLKRLSDESLGSRLASGEAAAFDELYRRYVHRLAAYGAHLLGDAASGDDVAQATLLKAYGALRAGRLPDRLRPWLFRIAHNTAIDVVTRGRELPAAELPDRPAGDGAEQAGALVAALSALPERQRRVYILRELHGLRIDETASELAMTVPQVEQALFAARNRMAEHLVFGDRLNCVAVQRLAAGPLDLDERRALKTHLRSCPECRRAVVTRMPGFASLPLSPVEWLRSFGGVAGGGVPLAAKVGAVVATATFTAGVPVAIETAHLHLHARSHHARHPVDVTAAATADPAGTAAASPVVFVSHPGRSTVGHTSTAVKARAGIAHRDEAPDAPTVTRDPVVTVQPTTATTTTSDDRPGDNRTGDRGSSGDRSSAGDGGTTTGPTDASSGDSTTQTQTPSGDGGTTSDGGDSTATGDGSSGDGGSSGSGSTDTSSTDTGSTAGDTGASGPDGGSGA